MPQLQSHFCAIDLKNSILFLLFTVFLLNQNALAQTDTTTVQDGVYNRPFIGNIGAKTAVGGYVEGNTNSFVSDGIPEGWQGPPAPLAYHALRNDAVDVVYGTPAGLQKLGVPYMEHILPPERWS